MSSAPNLKSANLRFAIFLTAALGLVFGLCAALYVRETGLMEQRLRERESVTVDLLAQFFPSDLRPVANDLRVLAAGEGLRAFLAAGRPADFDRAVQQAVFFSRQQRNYDKIRYLDENGREILRVNRGGVVIPTAALQDKSDRPFFKNARLVHPGQLYISDFDLNVENGRVEEPLKPTIRFATPVIDTAGRTRGVYVINFLGDGLLNHLEQTAATSTRRLRVLNDRGYWLKGTRPEQEWGFMFPGREGATLARTGAALWDQLSHEPEGQSRLGGGLFTWRRLVPATFASGDPTTVVADDAFLVIASEMSAEEWTQRFAGFRLMFLSATPIVLLLVVVCAWVFRARQQALRALREANDRLETRVLERTNELAQSNARLRDQENLLEETGRLAKVGGWDFDPISGDGRWTREVARIHELDPAIEPSRQLGLEFYPGESRVRIEAALKRATEQGEPYDLELEFVSAKGVRKWIRTIGRPVMENGKLSSIRGAFQDVTDRRQAEEEIRQLNGELEERVHRRTAELEVANKELEAFSYSVSHDLRAPLRHVQGFAAMLEREAQGNLSEKSQRYLKTIVEAARNMGQLIDDLLSFSRMGRSEMRETVVGLNALVESVRREIELAESSRAIRWQIADLPRALGDAAMIRQVWANLLENAVKYTRQRAPAVIEVGCAGEADGMLVLFVRDNGAGFDMKYANKLFGVFQRLHRAEEFEGTGIGLANVRRIVARHGGQTWAEGEPNVGATFYFTMKPAPKAV